MLRSTLVPTLVTLAALASSGWSQPKPVVRVGSKSFTENYVLGEIVARVIDRSGEAVADRRFGLGGTGITYRAAASGDIDLYPEYTGTIALAILEDPSVRTLEEIRRRLAPRGLTVGEPIGFDNTYALAVRRETADRLGLEAISDLKGHAGLTGAFSSGFLEREDGWPGLARRYGLRLARVSLVEHPLAYEALAAGRADLIDVFSTDGKLDRYDLRVLEDDRGFFPDYDAVLLVRQDFIDRFPATWAALSDTLDGRIDNREMVRLNARADLGGESVAEVAAAFLGQEGDPAAAPSRRRALLREIWILTVDHLYLVAVSLLLAAAAGIPLGIAAARFERLAQLELMSIGVLQTIPSLALLCFMIPLFGIGKLPALVALFLYALLPIVRNTYTGMIGLDGRLLEIATVLGLSSRQRLWRIELPLASLHIMSGVKTSAVFTVGTATLAAFIGGGGYGTLIVRGLALDDLSTILAGAVPAALMALAIHGLFEAADRFVIPHGLRKDFGASS